MLFGPFYTHRWISLGENIRSPLLFCVIPPHATSYEEHKSVAISVMIPFLTVRSSLVFSSAMYPWGSFAHLPILGFVGLGFPHLNIPEKTAPSH